VQKKTAEEQKIEKCKWQIDLGKMQEKSAMESYDKKDIVKTQEHLRYALSNYMSGFKACSGTKREEELSQNISRVNGILTNKAFRNTAALQKFFKASGAK